MPTNQKTQQICLIFQRALKKNDYIEVNKLSLKELKNADIDLGPLDLNSKHRLALQRRIKELEKECSENIAKNRHQHLVIISIISITVAMCIAIISWHYFS